MRYVKRLEILCRKSMVWHINAFKYSLPDLHKSSSPTLNYAELSVTHWFSSVFIK